ncbi:hypothetical protein SAMN05421820_11616 [Pedobacter steynii]|uniref:Uncharacterized protein n=1 Tax=Pedobacter steynii TaxID=430522 RepID=A0A1H0KCC9_9SPHI|nr:DUF6266 family protein [Pedobacter steynii]NQX43255.1 hypothetical protein [Pedobacter steynii]SDO53598.1 hypothetical protein SAMN05421820_11616 [Pedobacter steynii]
MAILSNSAFGHPNGKIGGMVYYMLKGQAVCRMIGEQGKPSIKQLANYQAMQVTMSLVKPMKEFIRNSFELEARGTVKNAHNLAVSYNKKQALQGEYPNISVDYSKVVLSYGTLPGARDFSMSKTETELTLNWNPESYTGGHDGDDILMILLYYPSRKYGRSFLNASRRDSGEVILPLSEVYIHEPIEAYACFKSADGKQISNSIYLGNINGTVKSAKEQAAQEKYITLKARFDQVEPKYLTRKKEIELCLKRSNKAFRNLETEYLSLKNKLAHLPGGPG